jgi:predicted amidohydrolase YtcJ
VAITRISEETRRGQPFLPDERLSLDEAMAAFTAGSAFVNHLDHETGTIEVGKLADLVLIDRNLRDMDGPIGEAQVAATWVEGVEVYARGPGFG